jgi:hypothetical protein
MLQAGAKSRGAEIKLPPGAEIMRLHLLSIYHRLEEIL